MKITLIITLIILLNFYSIKENPKDFEYTLSEIAGKVQLEIIDIDKCEKLRRAAEDLYDDIEDAIEKGDEYNFDEKVELNKLKREAEAMEEFIAVVGNCRNYSLSIEKFNLANNRVRATVAYVIKDKYCIDVISVSIGNYVAYLGENNSKNNYTVNYKWKAIKSMSSGYGTMGLSKLSIRQIYDNREKPSQKNIFVFGIMCKEF